MARPRKARVEGEVTSKAAVQKITVPAASEDFASFVELFQKEHAEEWETIRLCPLESGLNVMIERLK